MPSSAGEDRPAVSVIVRTKDRPALLAEALASLERQTFQGFEAVVVNDSDVPLDATFAARAGGAASPASGTDAAEPGDGASRRSVVVVEAGPPHGRSRALNVGIEAARGRWIAYLDDDDLYLPRHLEVLLGAVGDGAAPRSRSAFSHADLVRLARQADGSYLEASRDPVFGRPYDASRLLYGNTIPLLCLLHERSAWEEAGRYDESFDLFEDWEFLVRLCRLAPPLHVPEVTALYRLRDDGTNATTLAPWTGTVATEARRRVMEKHRALRTPEAEMAYADAAESEIQAAADREAVLLREFARVCAEWDGAVRAVSDLSAAAARGAEADRLAAELADSEAERARLAETVRRMTGSFAWRLFTPWWRWKAFLERRRVRPG